MTDEKAEIKTEHNYIAAMLLITCKNFVGMAVNIYAQIKKSAASAANCRSNNLPRVPHIIY